MSLQPLFVCSVPRSGTTLLADLLGGSPDALALQKTDFKFKGRNGMTDHADLERWRAAGDFTIANSDVEEHVTLPVSNREFYLAAIERYRVCNASEKPARIAIDHSPRNVQFAHVLAEAFPEARFIHLVRDGRAVFNSVKNLSWGPRTPYVAAAWWASQVAPGLALEQALGPDRVMRVRYEDLVLETENTLRALCAFAGIAFTPEMVGGGGVKLSPYAADVHPNIGQSPLASRLNAWEKQLSANEAEAFALATPSLLHWLGYPVPSDTWYKAFPRAQRMRWFGEELIYSRVIKPLRQKSRRRTNRVSFK